MSTLPRALHRARLWTTGLLTASTVLVGALGFHLAEAHAQALATRTPSATTDGSGGSGPSSSGDDFSQDSSSGFSDQDSNQGLSSQGLSNQGQSNQGSSQGFSPVGPVGGGGFQPQTNSGGS